MHIRESINHNQFPATVSLLCDHLTQLLSLNCIPFLPFSPWNGVEWISSLPTLCYSCFIVSGATPLWLSPMSPFTFREQAAVSASATVSTLMDSVPTPKCTQPGACIV